MGEAVRLDSPKQKILDSPGELRADMEGDARALICLASGKCMNGTCPIERGPKMRAHIIIFSVLEDDQPILILRPLL